MGQESDIKIENRGSLIIFNITGDVTAASDSAFKQAHESAGKSGNILLVFNPGCYINSGGIAVLIQLLVQARQNNQKIGLTGLSDHFKKIFQMVGITKFSKIYDSVNEALASM